MAAIVSSGKSRHAIRPSRGMPAALVGGYVVKGTARLEPSESLISVTELSDTKIMLVFRGVRSTPVRRGSRKLVRRAFVRTVVANKRVVPNFDGDYYWLATAQDVQMSLIK